MWGAEEAEGPDSYVSLVVGQLGGLELMSFCQGFDGVGVGISIDRLALALVAGADAGISRYDRYLVLELDAGCWHLDGSREGKEQPRWNWKTLKQP